MSQNSTKITHSVTLLPVTSSVVSEKGELAYNSTTDKVEAFIGAASANIVSHNYSGDTSFTGNHTQNGNETVTGTLSVSGAETVAGAFSALSTATISGAATVNNNLTVTGNHSVSGNTTLAGALGVTGTGTFGGVTVNGSETVTGNLGVTGTITSTGAATFNGGATINGNETVTGTLGVTGTTTLGGALTVNNNATVTGTLSASGAANFASTVTASGITNKLAYSASGIATPAAPAAGYYSVYPKTDGKLYIEDSSGNERAIGADGGTINFIGVNDRDAESSAYSWATYNDGSALPVDLTGGTASALTFSRTNTSGEVLNGSYSYKIVKAASSALGQGVSVSAVVPPAYQGKDVTITLPFYITSGSLVEGDLQVYIYDVTNSVLITPQNLNIVGKQGTLTAIFPTSALAATPANQTIRIGIHFASSSASALTIVFDDVAISPQVVQQGAIVTDFKTDANLTAGNFGTISNNELKWKREGDSIRIQGSFLSGTHVGSPGYITLPFAIDTTKVVTRTKLGQYHMTSYGSTITSFANPYNGHLFYDGSDTGKLFISADAGGSGLNKYNTNNFSSTQYFSFEALVPISGWNSNITIGSSSTYRISSYLANGTRVTGSAPTKLGEYRSYLRNASANTYTETNGAPATPPNATDGIKLYIAGNFSSAEPANQPSKYDIFVGKNKNIKAVYYTSPGFTGPLSPDCFQTATVDCGYETHYDNSTGVVTIIKFVTGDKPTLFPGHNQNSDFVVGTAYVDIIVSENALAVGMQKPRSSIRLKNGLSYPGATETQIRKFQTVVENIGSAITYTAGDSSNGDKFTINEDGVYSISYEDAATGSQSQIAITKNAPTSVGNLNPTNASVDPYLIIAAWPGTNLPQVISATVVLSAGDVIKAHTDGVPNYAQTYCPRFIITKVSD